MIAATAIASLALFATALWALGIARMAAGVLTTTRTAVATMRDRGIDDDARERAVQQASLRLFAAFGSILVRSLLALVISLAPVWMAGRAGLATSAEIFRFLSRWDVVLAATAVMVAGYAVWGRLWPSSPTTPV